MDRYSFSNKRGTMQVPCTSRNELLKPPEPHIQAPESILRHTAPIDLLINRYSVTLPRARLSSPHLPRSEPSWNQKMPKDSQKVEESDNEQCTMPIPRNAMKNRSGRRRNTASDRDMEKRRRKPKGRTQTMCCEGSNRGRRLHDLQSETGPETSC